jgi:hypothetical protein
MKKQTILVGFITAAFMLVATGASFAGDRRLHRPGGNHWKGKQFAAQKHRGQFKRGHQVRHPRANWKGRHHVPRHRWNNRGVHRGPGYRAPHNPSRRGWGPQRSTHRRPGQYGHRPQIGRHNGVHRSPGYRAPHNPSRRGWGPQRSAHRRPGQYGHHPQIGRHNERHPAGASFDRQHEGRGDRGHANNRPAISRGNRQDGRGHNTAVASGDTRSNRGDRDRASGRQRRTEAEL